MVFIPNTNTLGEKPRMKTIDIVIRTMIDKKVFSDFGRFNFFHLHHRWLGLVLFPLLMTMFAYFNLITGSTLLFVLFIGMGLVFPVGSILTFNVNLKNQIKANNLSVPRLGYTVSLSPEGIVVSTDREKAEYSWEQIFRIYRSKQYLYLYVSKKKAFILPLECIREGSEEDLVQLITDSIGHGRFIRGKW
jgi:hypothetical protein